MARKHNYPVARYLNHIVCYAAFAALAGCDQSGDVQSFRQQQDGKPIWLSAERPVVNSNSQGPTLNLAAQGQQTPTDAKIIALNHSDVCQGLRYRDGGGDEHAGSANCSLAVCTSSGQTDCRVDGAMRAIDLSSIEFDKINNDQTIAGQAGTFNANDPKYSSCTKTGDSGCTATNQFFAVAHSLVNEGTLKKGTVLGSITGKYPSTSYPLGASPAGKKALLGSTLAGALMDAPSPYYYFRYDGMVQSFTPDADFSAGNILTGKTIFGVSGTAPVATPSLCQTAGDKDCFLPAATALVAINTNDLSPGVIKKGVTVAGISGTYPSAATPLDVGPGRSDFTISQIATNTSFALFTKNGDRVEVKGAGDLATASNIRQGVTIFGTAGSAVAFDYSKVRPIDIRKGVAIPNTASQGKLKLQTTCTTTAECVGADKPWQDVTGVVTGSGSDCTSGLSHCVYRNQAQQLDWAFHLADIKKNWEDSVTSCKDLDLTGKGWRLATQKELHIAAAQRIDKLGHYGFYQGGSDGARAFWTSTANYPKKNASDNPSVNLKIAYKKFDNLVWYESKDKTYEVTCVRKAAP